MRLALCLLLVCSQTAARKSEFNKKINLTALEEDMNDDEEDDGWHEDTHEWKEKMREKKRKDRDRDRDRALLFLQFSVNSTRVVQASSESSLVLRQCSIVRAVQDYNNEQITLWSSSPLVLYSGPPVLWFSGRPLQGIM